MSARTDASSPVVRSYAQPWRLAGLLWALVNLVALAAGLFPQALSPSPDSALHALQVLAVAQVEFLLLVYPAVLVWRQEQVPLNRMPYSGPRQFQLSVWAGVIEVALWLLVAVPFWAAAAYFSDATFQDVVRTAIFVVCAFLPAWGLAMLARRGQVGKMAALLVAVILALAAPFALYLVLEFLKAAPAWLADLVPAALAWHVAQSRMSHWEPEPFWAFLVLPAVGIALLMLHAAVPRRR